MLATIDLQLGWPTPSLYPTSSLLTGATTVLTSPSESANALMYGPGAGYLPLRQNVAAWLTEAYTPRTASNQPYTIPPTRIAISNGASATLLNIALRFADPTYTRAIWMVEPTYFIACPIFADAGFEGRMRGVPEDDEGLDIGFLRAALQRAEAEAQRDGFPETAPQKKGLGPCKIYRHVVYAVPTFANPSGKTMSLRRREQLVRLAREFDALVVADDVYDVLRWPADPGQAVEALGPPPPRVVDVDRVLDGGLKDGWGNALSNGSFSKIVAPGVRVSWVEGTEACVARLAVVGSSRSGGNPAHLSSMFINQLIATGALQRQIRDVLIPTYRRRYYALVRAIEDHLVPLGVTIDVGKPYETTLSKSASDSASHAAHNGNSDGTNPHDQSAINKNAPPISAAGGFFIYLMLPPDLPTAATLAALALEKHRCKFAFGDMFRVDGDPGSAERARRKPGGFDRGVRLCWAWHEEELLVEGVHRIADAVREVRAR